jgi:putative transposase
MEAENGKTKKVYIRTNHIETERSRCTAKPGKISEGSMSGTGNPRSDLLPMAKGIRGYEYNPGKKTKSPGKRKRAIEEISSRSFIGQCDLKGSALKKVISPARRRQAVHQVQEALKVSERRACRVIGQPRATQRYQHRSADDEERLTQQVVELACEYGRYGYRRVTAMLRNNGWTVNHKRVERIWKREGLKVPKKQPKRSRLWLTDGSIVRLKPEFEKHVWSYDFMQDRTHNGVPFRILNVIDEFTRECLAVRVSRSLTHKDVIEVLYELFCQRGVPVHIRSDNGPEFIAQRLRDWLGILSVKPLFIEPGSPWENGYVESFNGKMRDELLAGEIFYSLKEAQVLIEMRLYNRLCI